MLFVRLAPRGGDGDDLEVWEPLIDALVVEVRVRATAVVEVQKRRRALLSLREQRFRILRDQPFDALADVAPAPATKVALAEPDALGSEAQQLVECRDRLLLDGDHQRPPLLAEPGGGEGVLKAGSVFAIAVEREHAASVRLGELLRSEPGERLLRNLARPTHGELMLSALGHRVVVDARKLAHTLIQVQLRRIQKQRSGRQRRGKGFVAKPCGADKVAVVEDVFDPSAHALRSSPLHARVVWHREPVVFVHGHLQTFQGVRNPPSERRDADLEGVALEPGPLRNSILAHHVALVASCVSVFF